MTALTSSEGSGLKQNAVSMFILIAPLKERQTENEFCEERKSIREKV